MEQGILNEDNADSESGRDLEICFAKRVYSGRAWMGSMIERTISMFMFMSLDPSLESALHRTTCTHIHTHTVVLMAKI